MFKAIKFVALNFPVLILLFLFSCKGVKKNENIVIVDVADFGREVIAREIAILDSLGPKVIAIDLQFSNELDNVKDSIFESALQKCDKLVMMSVITDDYQGLDLEYSELGGSIPKFLQNAKTGFANVLLEDDEVQTLKKFSVAEKVGGKLEYHFAIQTAMEYDSLQTISFINSNPKIVEIEYRGNTESFKIFSAASVLNKRISIKDVQGKIVLIGSFSVHDYDLFFTPLNKDGDKPDMFGVVYLANVIAQILED